jgi:UDP-N-acetylglucosamine diphosphorylase/glucosamine-1-phosphate N-acetyltransferase
MNAINVLLFDTPPNRIALKPFSDTRPIAKIRVGITTIEEKWNTYLPATYSFLTENYLQAKFPYTNAEKSLWINGSIIPNQSLVDAIKNLKTNETLIRGDIIIAFWDTDTPSPWAYLENISKAQTKNAALSFTEEIIQLKNKWDIFTYNAQAIIEDFETIKKRKTTQPLYDPHTIVYNPKNIFIEEGVVIKAAILDAELGPIYIGKNAIIEEKAVIRGPVAIAEGAQIKVGSYIYQGTTIGPYAKVGGEVSNSVIFGYSNKAHDGFLGHSVIGEWCNLGAYTTTSNLRNDYRTVTVWDDTVKDFANTNLQFCGLFMGDYSKCGIHTMFNTGTVVGVSTNLFGTGYFKRFIPSFSKGSPADNLLAYNLERALISIENTIMRRSKELTQVDKNILIHLSEEAMNLWHKSVI